MRNDGAPTSIWSQTLRAARRAARRSAMPLAWSATLGVVAFSAFAVRDTVFPALGHSATPSVWEPSVEASVPRYSSVPSGTTPDDVPRDLTRPTLLEVDLPDGSSSSVAESPLAPRSGELPAGPPYRGGGSNDNGGSGAAGQPGPTSSVAGGSGSPSGVSSTSSSVPATTQPTGSSSPSPTTDPATTDSIGGGQNGKGSGSGGGGTSDDHP